MLALKRYDPDVLPESNMEDGGYDLAISSEVDRVGSSIDEVCKVFADFSSSDKANVLSLVERERPLIRKIWRRLNGLLSCYPAEIEDYTILRSDPSMSISYMDGIYHYKLDGLLPLRKKLDVSSGRLKNDEDRDIIYSGYEAAVSRYAASDGFKVFAEKIIVLFVSHYGGLNPVDHDNLDVKPFIDTAINRVIVEDDSPFLVDLMFQGVSDNGRRFTEVFAGPADKILRIYSSNYSRDS